jgi:hypothetical protein
LLWTGQAAKPATEPVLPCLDSSPACLERLSALAVEQSQELKVLDEAIKLQKSKLWTTWLAADSFNPLGMALRVGRNLAGGGDRAAGKLTIDQLKLRRAEVIVQIRQNLITSVLSYEAAARARELASSRLAVYTTNLPIIELAYRLGDGETSAMLSLWEHGEELRAALAKTEAELARERNTIILLVFPQTALRPATLPLKSQ